MNSVLVQERLSELRPELDKLRVYSLSLFGSVAKGNATNDSDLDFLVEFDGPATFDGYMSLKELLELAFERKIDLVTVLALKPALKEQILSEAIRVA